MNKPFIFTAEGLTPDECFRRYAIITYYEYENLQKQGFTDQDYEDLFNSDPNEDELAKKILENGTKKFKERKKKLLIKKMHDKPVLKESPKKIIKFTTDNIEILKKCGNVNLKINKK